MNDESIYLPADLLESFATLCYRSDQKFISDVSKILGIPSDEIRRKVLEPHKRTLVRTTSNPWWLGLQCPIMIHGPGDVWYRCDAACECHGTCHEHRGTHAHKYRYDASLFKDLPERRAAKLGKQPVWVDKSGKVYSMSGEELKNISINLSNGLAIDTTDYGSVDKSGNNVQHTADKTEKSEEETTSATEEVHSEIPVTEKEGIGSTDF